MGFFSWDCKACKHPMLSHYAIQDKNAWMTDVVVVGQRGEVTSGEYDGYGRVGGYEELGDNPECYHRACWELVGKPTEFTGGSRSSRDQGYFFGDNEHNFKKPETVEDLHALKAAGDMADTLCNNDWAMAHMNALLFNAEEILCEIQSAVAEGNASIPQSLKEQFEKTTERISTYVDKEKKKQAEEEAKAKAEEEAREREYSECEEE